MKPNRLHRICTTLALSALLVLPAGIGRTDDVDVFAKGLPTNVMVLLDHSGSMAQIVWHPAYDPSVTPTCSYYDNDETYFIHDDFGNPSGPSDTTFKSDKFTRCGHEVELFEDPALGDEPTRYSGHYLNWLYDLDKDVAADKVILDQIKDLKGLTSICRVVQTEYRIYRRSRITAAKQILKDLMCEANEIGSVRFGLARFRDDAKGGYVRVPVNDYEALDHPAALEAALDEYQPTADSPLGETLFQLYTYFMSRDEDELPVGKNGSEEFPVYEFLTTTDGKGGKQSDLGDPDVPKTPVDYDCEDAVVLIISDGHPTYDDFSDGGHEAEKFNKFEDKLIGDYHADGEVEIAVDPDDPDKDHPDEIAYYLDDIALWMATKDYRPDLAGDQFVRTYTVSFGTDADADDLLTRTATNGNGQYFSGGDIDAIEGALRSSISSILQDAQSFTSSSIPASRSSRATDFYHTYFEPQLSNFWPGHLTNLGIDVAGQILDKNGDCALTGDPDPCISGPIETDASLAPPYWDAQTKMPTAANRTIYVSLKEQMTYDAKPKLFTKANLDKDDLKHKLKKQYESEYGLKKLKPKPDDEDIADMIVDYVRGCAFNSGDPCTDRSERLGDIFHSTPLVIGQPNGIVNDPSYLTFAGTYANRTKMIYAGSNGGMLHGFIAAPYDTSLTPNRHNRAHADAGKEKMAFIPYYVRATLPELPLPSGDKFYGVDGAPQAADVWFPSSALDTTKSANEWRTVLVGGLRGGGRSYYALDVTNPDDATKYPKYLWEFPCEKDCPNDDDWKKIMGFTWSEPVITRVRVAVDGNTNGGLGYERWVAIFGAGYSGCADPNADLLNKAFIKASKKLKEKTLCEFEEAKKSSIVKQPDKNKVGRAFFMLDIQTGTVMAVRKYDDATVTEDMEYAIPGNPAVFDLDFDGFGDVVYFSDTGGQVWKWVIRSVGEFEDDEHHDLMQPNWPLYKFFQVPSYAHDDGDADSDDGDGTYYKSLFHPPTGALRNGVLYLAFGTGERNALYFNGFSSTTAENNKLYVIRDADPYALSGTPTTIVDSGSTLDDMTDVADAGCDQMTSTKGFFVRAADGEKFTDKSTIFLGTAFATSFVPPGADPCAVGGNGFLYGLDMICGGAVLDPDAGPSPHPDPRVFKLGAGMPTRPRLSVGDVEGAFGTTGGGPQCDNMISVTTTAGNSVSTCAPDIPGRPVMHESWRER